MLVMKTPSDPPSSGHFWPDKVAKNIFLFIFLKSALRKLKITPGLKMEIFGGFEWLKVLKTFS